MKCCEKELLLFGGFCISKSVPAVYEWDQGLCATFIFCFEFLCFSRVVELRVLVQHYA